MPTKSLYLSFDISEFKRLIKAREDFMEKTHEKINWETFVLIKCVRGFK